MDAKGRRARRQGRADPVFPVLCREDAAPHHPDRQLHRQRQAAAAASEMEHEDRRHLYARAGRGRIFRRRHRLCHVHASACRSCRLEHAARQRPLGADLSRRRATCSARPSSTTGPRRTRKRRCRRSATACCRSSRPGRPRSCATITRSAIIRASCRRRAIRPAMSPSPSAAARTTRCSRGDLMHSPLQTRYPEMSAKFDVDQAQAATTRRNFLERYCDTDTLCCTAHFPSPSAGKIRRAGNGFSCEAI